MWVRLRLDINWSDLAAAACACGLPGNACELQRQVESCWSDAAGTLVCCLSVRSGFDLLLRALALPRGSEVLMSALTVPDMVRIVERHGLLPVPVDLEQASGAPCLASLRRALTPASRMFVVAHLFGQRLPLEPYLRVAREHNLLLVEDCAQAFCGTSYTGHADSDVALFSFGPIKTATALGGGMVRFRDLELAKRMRRIQSGYVRQSRCSYLRRVARYSLLKAASGRWAFGMLVTFCAALGIDWDRFVGDSARSFPDGELLVHIRRQPSVPLLRTLRRRFSGDHTARLRCRAEQGRRMAGLLGAGIEAEALNWQRNTFWVFPLLVEDPSRAVQRLRQRGFDASRRMRLDIVPSASREDLDPQRTSESLSRLVLLPWYPGLPPRAMQRMAEALQGIEVHRLTPHVEVCRRLPEASARD